MKSLDYVVKRGEVYLGAVVACSDNKLFSNKRSGVPHPNGLGIHIKSGQLYIPNGQFLRMMLFTPTKYGMADDLQWNSEKYPVLEMRSRADLVKQLNCGIAIDGCCNLGRLLEYFGCSDRLDNEGIDDVVRRFFTKDFVFNNCELFGYEAIQPEKLGYVDYDVYLPNTFNSRGRPVIYKSDEVAYVKTFEGDLPSEIFEFLCAARPLSNLGRDISIRECEGNGIPGDKFVPGDVEFSRGLVKLLVPRIK